MELRQYSESLFKNYPPTTMPGGISLLISGSLGSLSTYDVSSSAWIFNTASWDWSIDGGSNPTTGSLNQQDHVTGIIIGNTDNLGRDNRNNFKLCNKISLTISLGNKSKNYIFPILDKEIKPFYTYFRVDQPLEPIQGVEVYFMSSSQGSDSVYLGYKCFDKTGQPVQVSVEPYWSREETSVFNPIFNNVFANVTSSLARLVELITETTTFQDYGAGMYDGEYASSSMTASLDGESASAQPPYATIADGGYSPGIYTYYTVQREEPTVPAEMPDSFFTSIANISGRFLGAKNAYSTEYIGYKQRFSNRNLDIAESSTKFDTSVKTYERPGSYQVLGSVAGNLAESSSIFGRISGSLSGSFSGTMSGSFDGKIDGHTVAGELVATHSIGSQTFEVSGTVDILVNGTFSGQVLSTASLAVLGTISGSYQERTYDGVIETEAGRPIYTIQAFTGSVFPQDADVNAIASMSLSVMPFELLGFAPRSIYIAPTGSVVGVSYSDGNYEQVSESFARRYVRIEKPGDLPRVGDILFNTGSSPEYRLTEKKVYSKDLGKIFITDEYGHVSAIQ